MAKQKKPNGPKRRSAAALALILGNRKSVHADRRAKRQRTRQAKNRAALQEQA